MTITAIAKKVWKMLFDYGAPREYRERPCQGRHWRQRFPDVPKPEIRAFLSTFVEGFGYRIGERLKFHPDDQLLQIYRAHYPSNWMPDSLEFEILGDLLQKRYRVDPAQCWTDDLTLGRLFAAVRGQNDG